jgi:integrase/recombinase XerD
MGKSPRGRPQGSSGPVAVLTPAQVREVQRSARNSGGHCDRAELAFILSMELGLTAGELATLKAGHLIARDGRIREELKLRLRSKEKSVVLSSAPVRRTVANYCERHLIASAPEAPVFVSQHGGPLTRASLARLLTSLYRRAGVIAGSSRSGRRTKSLRRGLGPPSANSVWRD